MTQHVGDCMLDGKLKCTLLGRDRAGNLLFKRDCHELCKEFDHYFHVDPQWFWGARQERIMPHAEVVNLGLDQLRYLIEFQPPRRPWWKRAWDRLVSTLARVFEVDDVDP